MINFIVIWVSLLGLFQSDERSMLIRRKQVILLCLELCKHLMHVCVNSKRKQRVDKLKTGCRENDPKRVRDIRQAREREYQNR